MHVKFQDENFRASQVTGGRNLAVSIDIRVKFYCDVESKSYSEQQTTDRK